MNRYYHIGCLAGILPQEHMGWEITARRDLGLAMKVRFKGISTIVTGIHYGTVNGELVRTYELSRRKGCVCVPKKNPHIFGMGIPATVKERSGNCVRVHFDIDSKYDTSPNTLYFTYAIESSFIYCMPEAGSRVHVYFPSDDERDAYAIHAIRTSGTGSLGYVQNPDYKSFSNVNGAELEAESLTIQAGEDGARISLTQEAEIIAESVRMEATEVDLSDSKDPNGPDRFYKKVIAGDSRARSHINSGTEDKLVQNYVDGRTEVLNGTWKAITTAGTVAFLAAATVTTAGTAASQLINTGVDTGLEGLMSALFEMPFDFWESMKRNGYANLFAALIKDPVDAATGTYVIRETDSILAGLPSALKLERTYHSTQKTDSVFGRGWRFPYESRIFRDTQDTGNPRIHMDAVTGHSLCYENRDGAWVSLCRGTSRFVLEIREGAGHPETEAFLLTDVMEHTIYVYDRYPRHNQMLRRSMNSKNAISRYCKSRRKNTNTFR